MIRMESIYLLTTLFAALATTPAFVAASISITFDLTSCNGDYFKDLDVDVTCDGEGDCLFGDTTIIEGTVEAIDNFTDAELSLTPCLISYCPAENVQSAGTLCSDWLIPIENQTCGWPGMYNVTGTEIIPDSDVGDSLSGLVHIYISIVEECVKASASSDSDSSGGYTINYSMMGAMVGTAFGLCAFIARGKAQKSARNVEDETYFTYDETHSGSTVSDGRW
jgi:hypothetical protein